MKDLFQRELHLSKIQTILSILVCMVMVNSSCFAADEEYLEELEQEASTTTTAVATVVNKDMKIMERHLANERPSTYKFYRRLSLQDKQQIFKAFMADKSDSNMRMTHIQKKIMDRYLK